MGTMQDHDPGETQEWVDALKPSRTTRARSGRASCSPNCARRRCKTGTTPRFLATTPYRNTIPPEAGSKSHRRPRHRAPDPLGHPLERVAIILRANKESSELGGHIASFQSSALLYDIGFGHFWHGATQGPWRRPDLRPGPCVARHLRARVPRGPAHRAAAGELPAGDRGQGHSVVSAPVADARFLAVPDGVDGTRPADGDLPGALPQVPAGPRPRRTPQPRKVWAFLGDGECDEPESLGAISLAGREDLDNLIFVINCNLQRLDGPVRGNGKIIQELEGVFRGAGWNVIKVVWGSGWDKLLRQGQGRHPAEAHGRVRRRPVPGLQEQERRVRARALLQHAGAEGAGRRPVRRRGVEAHPRRPRPVQGLRGLRGRGEAQGPADGDPRRRR